MKEIKKESGTEKYCLEVGVKTECNVNIQYRES